MGFSAAVRSAMVDGFADVSGRAPRSEYWWFTVFSFLVALCVSAVRALVGDMVGGVLGLLMALVLIVPSVTVTVRRLHDTDRSGWWILIFLVPVIGSLALLVFMILPGTPGDNDYGPAPLSDIAARYA